MLSTFDKTENSPDVFQTIGRDHPRTACSVQEILVSKGWTNRLEDGKGQARESSGRCQPETEKAFLGLKRRLGKALARHL